MFIQGHNTDKASYLPKGTYKEGSTIDSMREPTVRPDIPLPSGACIFCRKNTSSQRACYSCREVDFKVNSKEHAEYLASIHDVIDTKQKSIDEGHYAGVTNADYEEKLALLGDTKYDHDIAEGCCPSHSDLFKPYCKGCGLQLPMTMVCDYC